MDSPHAERFHDDALISFLRENTFEAEQSVVVACSQGSEHSDRFIAQAAKRELEHECGGVVEPMDVVYRDNDRYLFGERADRAEERERDRSLIRRRSIGVLEQQSHGQRASLWSRESRKHVVKDGLEHIAEGREGEPCLRP